MPVFEGILREKADAIRSRIERLLGLGGGMELLLEEVRCKLAASEPVPRSLGGKKELGATRKEVLRIVRSVKCIIMHTKQRKKERKNERTKESDRASSLVR